MMISLFLQHFCLLNYTTFSQWIYSHKALIQQGVLLFCKSAEYAKPLIYYIFKLSTFPSLTSILPSPHALRGQDSYQNCVFILCCYWEHIHGIFGTINRWEHIKENLRFIAECTLSYRCLYLSAPCLLKMGFIYINFR